MKKAFSMQQLTQLDPKLDAAINLELKRLIEDMQDRPGETAARTLVIKIALRPDAESGALDTVGISFEIHGKTPPKKSREYSTEPHASGLLFFNPMDLDHVKQRTLDEAGLKTEPQTEKE